MCESSKSERPELESGHFQETDGSGKKVSRRSFWEVWRLVLDAWALELLSVRL